MPFPQSHRLVFRHYEAPDRETFVRLFTDPEVMRFVGSGDFSLQQADRLWTRLIDEFYPTGRTTIYAVFGASDGRYIGHASIRPRPETAQEWEIGYIVRRSEWGCGFGAEIAAALVEFGFGELGLERVFATVDDDNHASIRVAEKAGMRFLRHEFDARGRFSVYSVNAAD